MKLEDVRKIAILGAGIMGTGIAEVCARAGYEVIFRDISEELVERAYERIKKSLNRAVERGKISREDADAALSRINGTTDLKEAVKDADIVIEAVPEIMDLKKKIFKEIDEICPEHTIFASNTSSLMITELASATKRPDKFIGMHWFNPAPVMKLIEIIPGILTSEETYNLIVEFSKKLGKIPIKAKDGPGFFTTRFLAYYLAEAVRLLEEGVAGVKEIDDMVKLGFNWPMGPFELMDFIGLDTTYHILEYIYGEIGNPAYKPPLLLKKLVTAGFIGHPKQKPGSKGGFYEYFKIPRKK